MLPRLLSLLAPPTDTPGRRSYHRVIYLVGTPLLVAVLLAPPRVAGVVAVGAIVAWWLADHSGRNNARRVRGS